MLYWVTHVNCTWTGVLEPLREAEQYAPCEWLLLVDKTPLVLCICTAGLNE
jgi:hypothetical protein